MCNNHVRKRSDSFLNVNVLSLTDTFDNKPPNKLSFFCLDDASRFILEKKALSAPHTLSPFTVLNSIQEQWSLQLNKRPNHPLSVEDLQLVDLRPIEVRIESFGLMRGEEAINNRINIIGLMRGEEAINRINIAVSFVCGKSKGGSAENVSLCSAAKWTTRARGSSCLLSP